MDISEYYRKHTVRERIIDFLGGTDISNVTSLFITDSDSPKNTDFTIRPPKDLGFFLDHELDLSRSLWDRRFLLAHLDIEYVNFDFEAEPYLDAARTFQLQEPTVKAVERILQEYRIAPRHFISGRGHHFVWQIRRDSRLFDRLALLGHLSEGLEDYYRAHPSPTGEHVDRKLGEAFVGLGMIMEFIAHHIRATARSDTPIPVELSALAVPPQERGREMISIDISEYGDPLSTRVCRVPFTVYLKPWRRLQSVPEGIRSAFPRMALVPLHEMNTQEGYHAMRDLKMAEELATRASSTIPDQTDATEALLDVYDRSSLAGFHRSFYSVEHEPVDDWPHTYDMTSLQELPECVVYALRNPNDLLKQPVGYRLLVRALTAFDWHPRHIAGLIRSKFERDYGWGSEWLYYHAATRADFYTRIFAAQLYLGIDTLEDLSCESLHNAGVHTHGGPPCELEELKSKLTGVHI